MYVVIGYVVVGFIAAFLTKLATDRDIKVWKLGLLMLIPLTLSIPAWALVVQSDEPFRWWWVILFGVLGVICTSAGCFVGLGWGNAMRYKIRQLQKREGGKK